MNIMEKTPNIKYFAVIYCHDGTIHLAPGDTQAECLERLAHMTASSKVLARMKATTVIKRDMSNFKDDMIFGNPKSLDVLQNKKIFKGL